MLLSDNNKHQRLINDVIVRGLEASLIALSFIHSAGTKFVRNLRSLGNRLEGGGGGGRAPRQIRGIHLFQCWASVLHWANIETTLAECHVFTGSGSVSS